MVQIMENCQLFSSDNLVCIGLYKALNVYFIADSEFNVYPK